jgi:hypothetical protein
MGADVRQGDLEVSKTFRLRQWRRAPQCFQIRRGKTHHIV